MKTFTQGIKNRIKRAMLPKVHITYPDKETCPVFIIGTNRSGTSVVSRILSQHPDLEGLFEGNEKPQFKDGAKHATGYCESYHLWTWLNSIDSEFHSGGENAPLWCHPQYISQNYRSSTRNKKEAIDLLNSVEKYRETNRIPLIKDQLNLLRLGMLKEIYPNAKIIFVYRNFDDYLPSCDDTWYASKNLKNSLSIGQHWLTGNQIALYDLKTYFPDSYYILNYNDLLTKENIRDSVLNDLLKKFYLKQFKFNTEMISNQFRFNKEKGESRIRVDEDYLEKVYRFEKEFLNAKT